nr:heavy metal translocating P-type ATPase [Thiospirillum jenense]
MNTPGYSADALANWLELLPAVQAVNTAAHSICIQFQSSPAAREQILQRLANYQADADVLDWSDSAPPRSSLAPLVSGLVTLALLPLLPPAWRIPLALINAAPTLAQGGMTLVRDGVKVEVLDALAVGLSAVRGEVYAATVTECLLALGNYLEQRTARQSDRLLQRLLQPAPAPIWVERAGGLVQMADNEVAIGDIVQVGPGERIGVDGRVLDGVALVDQSAVTGEATPVRKEMRRRVICGSVVLEGRLRIEATHVGVDTTAARVAHFIRDALTKRSTVQREAEQLADQRVNLTLATGAAIYALTRDVRRLQAVFLVDYACALKLGTPMAIKSGMAQAAAHGVLMRGGEAIEQLAMVDTVIFDKTGTLTHSQLLVTDIEVFDSRSCSQSDLLALVASIEEHSAHPLANAVVQAAQAQGLPHVAHGEVDYVIAHGLSTTTPSGGRVIVGSRHYLEAHEQVDFSRYDTRLAELEQAGKQVLLVGNAHGAVGVIALRDTVRAETAATLTRLRALGVRRLVLLTGDRWRVALALGEQLGFDEIHAEVTPEDKAAVIAQLQATGARVAFVGDGVNDGPALTAATVGIAMPRGAEIARATADIVLLDDRLDAIADAYDIAIKTQALIRFNFRAAVGVNTALLAGAVSGHLSPLASAVLHNGTTVGVLLNALRGV